MCQLLGMNCNVPTDICFSFTGFQMRGGVTDVHKDGWGIAFFEGKGVRQFLDSQPSAHSPVAELVRNYPIKSKNVVSHIRKATQGVVALENTHPFSRELWGYYWIFAHNGTIPNYAPELDGSFLPVGQTDSEKTFCWMLQEMKKKFKDQKPANDVFLKYLQELTLDIGSRGEFNYLLSNGELLIAHCSTQLTYIIRQAPFAEARLKDQEVVIDFGSLTTEKDRVAVVATVPLTNNEAWITIDPGQLLLFQEGKLVTALPTVAGKKTAPASPLVSDKA